MAKRWIRNKFLADAYGDPIRIRDYEKPDRGLMDLGPDPKDKAQHIYEILRTDMDTSFAIQHLCNTFLQVPLKDMAITALDLELTQRVLRAAVRARKDSQNYITLEEKDHDWLLRFFKDDKWTPLTGQLFGTNAWVVKEALEDLLRPEEREPRPKEE